MKFNNFSKRIFAIIFTLCLLPHFTYNYHAASLNLNHLNYQKMERIEGSGYTAHNEPKLELVEGNNLGSVVAGKQDKIKLSLKNTSQDSAHNIKIELKPDLKNEKNFVRRDFVAKEKYMKPTDTKDFSFPLEVNSATPEGTYPMTLKLSYRNSYFNTYTDEIPVYIYIKNFKVKPLVEVQSTEFKDGWVSSDEATKMRINLINNGNLNAKNVQVKLDGLDPKGVNLVKDSAFRKFSGLGAGMNQIIGFDLQANPNVEQDVEISVIITYVDEVDNKYETTQKILVPCSQNSGKNKFSSLEMNFSKSEYHVYGDSDSTVSLNLKNNSKNDIKNLKLELLSDGSVVFMSKYIDVIDNLKAGEDRNFNYKVISSNPETDGSHPITAKLSSSSDNSEKAKNTIEIAGVICHKKGGAGEGKKPKIIISDYGFSGDKIVAGKEFVLSIKIKNTSQSIGVKNVKLTHSSQDEVFIPIDAANSVFIENIPPNGVVEKKIKLTSKPDAAAKMYKMTFVGEYEDESGKSYDEKGNPFKSEESIVLNLTQEIRLEIPELKIQEFASVSESIPIDIEFYNMGKAPLYNMMVKLEGDFDSDISNYFVGNFEASKSDMFSSKITPKKSGELKGKLIFEFEDESGNKDKKIKEFKINIEESPEVMNDMKEADPENNSEEMGEMEFDENGNQIEKSDTLSVFHYIIIAVVLLILIIILKVVLKKRKKKKLEKLLLESDDEDK